MNAIIIAAGIGSRLRPLTYDTPKPLVNVLGKPMLERNIEYLIESNIKEIIIVVGYLKEKFEYLEKKYKEVRLIFNNKFYEYNNIYSFYLIREYLEDSYILDGDIFIVKNIFNSFLKDSGYLAKRLKEKNNEWQLITKNSSVRKIEIGGGDNYIISGVSFFKEKDTEILKKLVEKYIKENKKNYFWDDIVRENIKEFDIKIYPVDKNIIFEIDNLEELKLIDKSYSLYK